MTTTSHNRETLATCCVIEKGNEMLINGIGESAESNNKTYAMRDYSRKATKTNTPIRWITQHAKPQNLSAWLNEFSNIGAMARTLNNETHYETGHALGVWDKFSTRVDYPLMPKGVRAYRGVRGVSVERALTITEND